MATDNEMLDRNGSTLHPGMAVAGQAVDGAIIEGNVEYLQPYGCEWMDSKWTRGTVVIKDHEDGHLAHWNPDNVEKI